MNVYITIMFVVLFDVCYLKWHGPKFQHSCYGFSISEQP